MPSFMFELCNIKTELMVRQTLVSTPRQIPYNGYMRSISGIDAHLDHFPDEIGCYTEEAVNHEQFRPHVQPSLRSRPG